MNKYFMNSMIIVVLLLCSIGLWKDIQMVRMMVEVFRTPGTKIETINGKPVITVQVKF